MSAILPASLADRPYEFIIVVKTSTASDVSRKPALAKLVAVPTKLTALAVSTEADIAWYVASAISVALRPVSVDSCNISLLSLFNDTLDVSAIVPTLATPLPKSDANFADPANTPPATADILEKLRPAFSILPPIPCRLSPNALICCAPTEPNFFCSSVNPFNFCSVLTISRCRSLYCASVTFTSPLSTCFNAVFSVSNFSLVLPIEVLSRSCFCFKRVTLPGSSFKSELTPFNSDCSDLALLLTSPNALLNLVVSPPI